jgi:hypothetical protein
VIRDLVRDGRPVERGTMQLGELRDVLGSARVELRAVALSSGVTPSLVTRAMPAGIRVLEVELPHFVAESG